MFYTGVTQRVFEIIYTFVEGDEVCNKLKYEYRNHTPKIEHTKPDLTSKDKMFLTLLRLRTSRASRIAYTWIRFLSLQFSKLRRHMFTSASAQNALKPKCFEEFPNLRIVIDATEFKIQHPRHFQHQNNTFSHYKKGSTMKFLVGISCFGGLSFLSEGYEGSMTDRKLVIASGLLDFLEPGDAVMADRGFDIEDPCDEKEVHLLIPAFQDGRTHFTARELIFN
ncbi:Polyketide synthase [Frankliniella fusca]|uniref:Polyketide synthase n=1 Tax=Frankliniella fusca TaxID=407009 RepID=A0AAE1LP92_9NEOP|nr:Polyketide synthase [Frankliniella fusca]